MQIRWLILVPLVSLASCVVHKRGAQVSPEGVQHPPPPMRPTRTIAVHVGEREVRDFDDTDTDDQFQGGAEFVMQPANSPLALETGLFFSGNTEDDLDAAATDGGSNVDEVAHAIGEFYAGLRLTSRRSQIISPYLGFGVSLLSVTEATERVNGRDEDDHDTTIGAYARVGFIVPIDPVVVGVDFRIVRLTDVDLNEDVAGHRIDDVDSEQVSIFVGWRF